MNLTWSSARRITARSPLRHEPTRSEAFRFPVNFNKPNYYVQMLNGLSHVPGTRVNATHLEAAKFRLEHWFAGIFILERPRSFEVLSNWLPGVALDEENVNKNKTSIALSKSDFRKDNDLDYQLYQYAIKLSESQSQRHRRDA